MSLLFRQPNRKAATPIPEGRNRLPMSTGGMFGLWQDWTSNIRLSRDIDLQEIGDGSGNSIVANALDVLGNGFSEPDLRPATIIEGNREWIDPDDNEPAAQFARLLRRPNPTIKSPALMFRHLIASVRLEGNAYWHKARDSGGQVAELWPLNPTQWQPVSEPVSNPVITSYRAHIGARQVTVPAADMVHVRVDIDPNNHRRGTSKVQKVLREVLSDEEAALYTTALLHNAGVPPVVVIPKTDGLMVGDAGDFDSVWVEKTTRRNRGKPITLNAPVEIKQMGMNPEQMNLSKLRRLPEERISGAIGVPAALALLGAGMEVSSGRNELTVLKEFWTEAFLIPLWRDIAQQLWWDVYCEFDDDPAKFLKFDLGGVQALQEDQNKAAERNATLVREGIMKLGEARAQAGLPVEPHHDVFYRGLGTLVVPDVAAGFEPPPPLPSET